MVFIAYTEQIKIEIYTRKYYVEKKKDVNLHTILPVFHVPKKKPTTQDSRIFRSQIRRWS